MSYLLASIILLLAVPFGYLIRYFTKDELKIGKLYFKVLVIISLIISVAILIAPIGAINKKTIISSMLFIAIVSFISWK